MLFAIIWSQLILQDSLAGTYDLRFIESSLFSHKDRKLITKYLSDDYLFFQKQKQREKFGEKLFRYLRDSAVEDVKKEMAQNPYADIEWPDNREALEILMLKIENTNIEFK